MKKYILIRTNDFGVTVHVFQTRFKFEALNPENIAEKLIEGYKNQLNRGPETLMVIAFPQLADNSVPVIN